MLLLPFLDIYRLKGPVNQRNVGDGPGRIGFALVSEHACRAEGQGQFWVGPSIKAVRLKAERVREVPNSEPSPARAGSVIPDGVVHRLDADDVPLCGA